VQTTIAELNVALQQARLLQHVQEKDLELHKATEQTLRMQLDNRGRRLEAAEALSQEAHKRMQASHAQEQAVQEAQAQVQVLQAQLQVAQESIQEQQLQLQQLQQKLVKPRTRNVAVTVSVSHLPQNATTQVARCCSSDERPLAPATSALSASL
jgi:Tfp pilus assembly protein FimV